MGWDTVLNYFSSSFPLSLPHFFSRLKPAVDLPRTQLPTQQALLWGAPLAMALPAPKIPRLPLASSPLSPPKEPPTHLGVAPPTLRTLPTPAGMDNTHLGLGRLILGAAAVKSEPQVCEKELETICFTL